MAGEIQNTQQRQSYLRSQATALFQRGLSPELGSH